MPRKTIEERLAQLDAQKKALKARLSKQERTEDTRRKVLLGAFILIASSTAATRPPGTSPTGCVASCPASSPATLTGRCSTSC